MQRLLAITLFISHVFGICVNNTSIKVSQVSTAYPQKPGCASEFCTSALVGEMLSFGIFLTKCKNDSPLHWIVFECTSCTILDIKTSDSNIPISNHLEQKRLNVTDWSETYEQGNLTLTLNVAAQKSSSSSNLLEIKALSSNDQVEKSWDISVQVLAPYLEVYKTVDMINLWDEEMLFTVTIQHSAASTYTAYNISLQDEVSRMRIINYSISVDGAVSISRSDSLVERIEAKSPNLTLGSSMTLVYFARPYVKNSKIASAEALITWSNGIGTDAVYAGSNQSNPACINHKVVYKNKYLPNYGYICLGIVLGIVFGLIFSFLLIVCVKRCRHNKKYVLHPEETSGQVIPNRVSLVKPTYQQMMKKREFTSKSGVENPSLLKKLAFRRSSLKS